MKYSFNQENLNEICKRRSLKSSELHSFNDHYGNASIIKEYCNLPLSYPLKGIIEHGLFLDDTVWTGDYAGRLPVFLSSTNERTQVQNAITNKPSIPIGSPFLYAMHNYENNIKHEKIINRSGTVVFPEHSVDFVKATFNHEDYADKLNNLPDRFKPITVCVFWKDFFYKVDKVYRKKGFNLVSAGHFYDPLFLYRLYEILKSHKYATSNTLGSSVFFSIKAGCNFFFTPSSKIQFGLFPSNFFGMNTKGFVKIKKEFESLFFSFNEQLNSSQIEFADKYIGSRFFRTKEELKDILNFCEKRYKFFNSLSSLKVKGTVRPYILERISEVIKRSIKLKDYES